MSGDGFMDIVVKFNSQTVGRDRIIRLMQYGSKLVAWLLEQARLNRDMVVTFQNLEFSLSTGRKLLRLGRFLDTLHGALKSLHLQDLVVRVTLTLARISNALFLLTDHVLWIGRMGLADVNKAKWTKQSNKFWLLSVVFALVRDVYELWLAMEGEFRNKKHRYQDPQSSVARVTCQLRNHKDVVVDTVKNGCDLFLPMTTLGYVKFSPGLVGLLGVISSVAGIAAIVSPTLKLQPS